MDDVRISQLIGGIWVATVNENVELMLVNCVQNEITLCNAFFKKIISKQLDTETEH